MPQEIPTLERKINLPEIIRSSEPSVLKLRQENFNELLLYVTACVKNYLDYCFPNQSGIATQFANDLIDTRPTWKAADFISLFKFFRQNAHLEGLKVFGNTITGSRLMEMVAVYEEHRAGELQKMHEEKRGNLQEQNRRERTFNDTDTKALFGRMAEDAAARQEEKRVKYGTKETPAPDETYFKEVHGVK